MAELTEVRIPDIGDTDKVDVIEILVNVGDTVAKEDSLIVLESDKASMEVPSSAAGVVREITVAIGDKVSEGDLIVKLDAESGDDSAAPAEDKEDKEDKEATPESEKPAAAPGPKSTDDGTGDQAKAEQSDQETGGTGEEKVITVEVPDIGDAGEVDVIEISVSPGDELEKEDSMIVLESDKATMEVPAPQAGTVEEILISVGDKASQGSKVLTLRVTDTAAGQKAEATPKAEPAKPAPEKVQEKPAPVTEARPAPVPDYPVDKKPPGSVIHASPAVRRFARELGADLANIKGSGPKNRITREDVQSHIKYELSRPKATAATGAFATPEMPEIDHSKWGEVETRPLTRIQKISSVNLHRNWVTIPHVTQHEDADVTDLEAFRKSLKDEAAKKDIRLTPLAFIMKALVASLKAYPAFNASLANDGENLILKKYFHIGVAVDTPDGLVVPVIRDVDQKSIYEIAAEMGELSIKARDKKLGVDAMQGSGFTISSLGGIGGTAFTPIVNWPNVAILGLSRNQMKPVWNGKEFEPRLMLPMSLSYDHRVIDGAVAARFIVDLSKNLADIRRVLL